MKLLQRNELFASFFRNKISSISLRFFLCNRGDSGAPLVALNGEKPTAIGIASFGSFLGCAFPIVPVVYTATSMYTNWIEENMGEGAKDLCFVEKTSKPTK